MINISGLDNSVFAPQAPITGDNTNFAKNLSAIINPTQALEQKQNEQIAKSVADLQMSSIYPKIQQKFLEAREKYISDYKDALKSHKGMGRLKLTPQEQLNFDRRKADMQNYVAWGKGATASLDKVNQDVIAALKAGEIEPGAYEKWFNGYMDEITKSKNGGDVPNAYSHFINANLIHPKVKPEDKEKNAKEQFTELEGITNSIKTGLSEQGYFKPTSDQVENYVKNKFSPDGEVWKNYIKPRLAKAYGLDPTITDDNTIVKKLATSVLPEIRTKTPPVSPEQKQTTWYKTASGTEVAPAIDKSPRDVKIGNETMTVKGVQANYNPNTGKTVYDVEVQKQVPKNPDELNDYKEEAQKDPKGFHKYSDGTKSPKTNEKRYKAYVANEKNYEKKFVPAQYTSDDTDALNQFFEEPPKGRGTTKKIVPSTTKETEKTAKDYNL